jgi:PHS family inorganic phosphate transporter-like MFS transporter
MHHSYGANARRHQTKGEETLIATSIDTRQTDFSEMDNAGISKEHWKIMLISGMGFFTDAYDLFIIGVVMALLKPMWHVGKVEEGLVESTANQDVAL